LSYLSILDKKIKGLVLGKTLSEVRLIVFFQTAWKRYYCLVILTIKINNFAK